MQTRRVDVVLWLGWVSGGLAWVVALFLPWRSRGFISESSLIEAVQLLRRGVIDDIVAPSLAYVLVAPAVAGLGVVLLAAVPGSVARLARALMAGLGTVLVGVLAWRIAGGSVVTMGPGAVVAACGAVVLLAAVVRDLATAGRRGQSPARPGGGG